MKYLLSVLFSISLFAQTQVVQQPLCSFNFGPLTATGAQPVNGLDFHNQGCMFWTFEYKSTGFSVVSIVLQGAPDMNGSPGTWVTLPGTVSIGTNPATSITGAFTAVTVSPTNAAAWIRINLTTATGTGSIAGRAYGYPNTPGGMASGGCPSPCPVIGPDAVGSPPTQPPVEQGVFDGTNEFRTFIALQQAQLTISAGTDIVLVAGTAAKTTYIPKFDIVWDNAADLSIREGTGVTCGTGTAIIAGPYKSLTGLFEDYSNMSPLVNNTQGDDLCLHWSASVTGGGQVKFTKF
jgi:hypothetical protein